MERTPASFSPLGLALFPALLVALFLGLWPGSALAFDIGYHFDLTREALLREAFSPDALATVQLHNYLDDGFESAKEVAALAPWPFSAAWTELYGPASFRDASDVYLHFDDLQDYAQVQAAWDRLTRSTYLAAKEAERRGDPAGLLAVLGMSLHAVQDFYSHSNWVELSWGGDATWFDVPEAERSTRDVYSAKAGRIDHASINKDHAGRPHFEAAYRHAFYASRQWTALVRSWVGAGFWAEAISRSDGRTQLEAEFVRYLTWYSGHWKGPGGESQTDLLVLGPVYLGSADRSYFTKWKEYCPLVTGDPGTTTLPSGKVPYTAGEGWLSLRTTEVRQTDNDLVWDIDVGGRADFYAVITVNGFRYYEPMYLDQDSVSPGNWLTMVPFDLAGGVAGPPVGIVYSLWDEDVTGGGVLPSLRGGDDHCDIAVALGTVDWESSGPFGAYEGAGLDVSTNGLRKVPWYRFWESDGDGDEAAVKFTVRAGRPARRAFSPALHVELSLARTGDVRIVRIDKFGEAVTVQSFDRLAIDMSGWTLVSVTGSQRFRFPSGFVLPAGATVTIRSGPGASGDGRTSLFWTRRYVWNNEKPERGELYDAFGARVSQLDA